MGVYTYVSSMGGVLSNPLVESEKTSWVLDHNLGYIPKIREEQLKLLPNFERQLQLCFKNRSLNGVKYQHWWVTDTTWIIEFDSDEHFGHSVSVHCKPRTGYTTDCSFQLTPDVMDRMVKVCGASNYSLALRNCEHLARYIHCGAWISFQMVGSGPLKNCFFSYMSTFTKIINTFPEELRPEEQVPVLLYPDAPENIINLKYSNSKDVLAE